MMGHTHALSGAALYVAPDGTAYRLAASGVEAVTGEPFARYDVLTLGGAQTATDALPEGARIVWSPTLTGGRS